jgi:Immunoglobulin domain
VSWRRENYAVLPTGGSQYRGNILTIPSVSKDDRGTYYCVAENGVGKGKRRNIAVEVEFSPVITVPRYKKRNKRPNRASSILRHTLDLNHYHRNESFVMTRHVCRTPLSLNYWFPHGGSSNCPLKWGEGDYDPSSMEIYRIEWTHPLNVFARLGSCLDCGIFSPLLWPPSPCVFLVVASPSGVLLNLKETVALPLTNERNEIVQTASRTSVAVRYGSGMSRGCLPASSNYLVERRHSTLQ